MEHFKDLSIILKSFQYQERDKIAVCLTENHGKVTGLAKGAVHSRRYGGTLDFLACSNIDFVQKPHSEMARIDRAVIQHEFKTLHSDFSKLTAASFASEFCLKLMEDNSPSREMFVILSNFLFQLDKDIPTLLAVNAFLCKAFKNLGYAPSLLRCTQCQKGAHELKVKMYWESDSGGMVCSDCMSRPLDLELTESTLLHFHNLSTLQFKQLSENPGDQNHNEVMHRILSDFLHHQIPGLPVGGFKSWRLLETSLLDSQPHLNP